MATLLAIRDLCVDYDALRAVDQVSLTAEAGDVVGLIGPNGAGKTTTFRAVAGLLERSGGQVEVAGIDVEKNRFHARSALGFMLDNCPVHEQLTVLEFLEHFARAGRVDDRAKRIDICLQLAWLTEKRTALCGELSRGMKQRLTLAKTLLTDPAVLLLDEPASGIDPLGRIELRKLILQLKAMGKAIVISSHILSEMSEFCNKVAIMERGRVLKAGPIEDLLRTVARRPILCRWRLDHAAAAEVFAAYPGVTDCRPNGQSCTFQFQGDEEQLDGLLAELIRRGVRVTEWRSLGSELEHLLVESGARAVS